MKSELKQLIVRFRAAQDIGVETFVNVLKLPLPSSGREWVRYCSNNGIYKLRQLNGVGIYADTVRGGYLYFERTLMLQPADGGIVSFFSLPDAKTLSWDLPGYYLVYRRD